MKLFSGGEVISTYRQTMDNSTVLYQLAIRLDDATLLKLHPSSWNVIAEFMKNQHFWYLRLKFISGKNLPEGVAQWSYIYKLYTAGEKLELLKYCLSNMHLVTVYEMLYSRIDWTAEWIGVRENAFYFPGQVSERANLEVILHALKGGTKLRTASLLSNAVERGDLELANYIITEYKLSLEEAIETSHLILSLEHAARRGDLDIVSYVFSLPNFNVKKYIGEVLKTTAGTGRVPMLQLLLTYDPSEGQIKTAAGRAAGALNNPASLDNLQFLLSKLEQVTPTLKASLLEAAVHGHNMPVIKLFFDEVNPPQGEKRKMLNSAITSGEQTTAELIEFLLKRMNPATGDTNQALKIAGNNLTAFKLLLADRRINPQDDFTAVLKSTNERLRVGKFTSELRAKWQVFNKRYEPNLKEERVSDAYIRDPRVYLDELGPDQILLVIWSLRAHIKSSVVGYTLATGLSEDDLYELLETGESTYNLLLREIVLKRSSAEDILRWLIDKESIEVGRGAESARLGTYCELESVPYKGLILSMLYPSLRLQELLDLLKKEGADDESTLLAAGLIGAHKGEQYILLSQ